MGAVSYGVYRGMGWLLKCGEYPSRLQNILVLFPAIIVGVLVYGVLEIVLKGISEAELRALPKGYLIVRVAKKCHLLK